MKIDKDESKRVGIKVLRKKNDGSDKIPTGGKKKQSNSDFVSTDKTEKFFKRNGIDD